MTALCLAELEPGGDVADASLRALSFARGLAASGAGATAASGEDATGEGATGAGTASGEGEGGLAAVLFGDPAEVPGEALAAYGVTAAYVVERLPGYAPVAWARVLAGLVPALGADLVVAAGTDRGSEVMAHLGALAAVPVAANCTAAERAGPGAWRLTRQRWAGLLLEDAELAASPALLTVAADAVAAVPADAPAPLDVHIHEPELAEGDLRVQATESATGAGGASLGTARVVVGGGRGVGGPDGFAPLEELAELLGGVLGVSRVVTGEGWRPHRQQVGQTGTRITPELYLACGISGAIQHLAGCQGARHVVAVNTDPDAPIMSRADYAVIGDLHEVIPALVAAIRARASGS